MSHLCRMGSLPYYYYFALCKVNLQRQEETQNGYRIDPLRCFL